MNHHKPLLAFASDKWSGTVIRERSNTWKGDLAFIVTLRSLELKRIREKKYYANKKAKAMSDKEVRERERRKERLFHSSNPSFILSRRLSFPHRAVEHTSSTTTAIASFCSNYCSNNETSNSRRRTI